MRAISGMVIFFYVIYLKITVAERREGYKKPAEKRIVQAVGGKFTHGCLPIKKKKRFSLKIVV